ncbi:Exodeoxyribonuclease V gamma chain (EC [Olavius sp. associated proteobacterium Delta 1]|nr:Exodeoxyribonuclease V gamma chain (EC [Olavius sp. associated proteobacterium Delta 1]
MSQANLNIYTSNRMEILVEQLAQIIRTPLPSPLAPEIIVVQSRGMERWIAMGLAEFNGISANCCFPFPNVFLESIFKKVKPDLPEISPFDPAALTLRLMRIIPDCLNLNGFENLRSFLADDNNQQLKLFQLAGKIADLFDQYLVFRPELIFEWEAKKEKKKPPHIWQARLWRELVGEIGNWHRARLRKRLFQQIKQLSLDTSSLPARVSIFGISYLPLFHLQAYAELSRLFDINFFMVDPCKEYWSDIVSDREITKNRRKNPKIAENVEWYHLERGNRLLASMGTQGRDFFDLVTGFDCPIHEQFEEPEAQSVLACLQSDVLNLRDREGSDVNGLEVSENLAGSSGAAGKDESIQVHSCHSPMREIEILHDNLLAMFEEDPELLPRDVIVMTPDIETYAPFVHAVFGAQSDEILRIPFSIADQSYRRENRTIDGFLALLDTADSRFGAVQVVRLLEYSGIKEKFGLKESDLKIIERWIKETHIRWGIDETSRIEADLPGYPENTWRAGLDRIILGYAMPGESRTMFNGILPFDNIEGSETQVLGRFLEFVDRLFLWSKTLGETKKLSDWQKTLLALIDQFFRPEENTEREFQLLRQALDDLGDKEVQANFQDGIEPRVIRFFLKSYLEQNNYGAGFLTGGITFCAMLPMRSIPFKVICLIGLNNDAFPREHRPLNFDLMAQHPRTGDRSRRNDDKYLFLESIISARQKFYISYVGQSIQDNSRIPPSVLVSELLDTIEKSFESTDSHIIEHIVTHHRLQPFSAWYFRADSGLFSYSTENMLAGSGANEKKEPLPFFDRRLPLTAEESDKWKKIDLESMCRFFNNPAMFLVQRRLGIRLEDEALLSEERENFELQPLEGYLVGQNLVKSLVSGVSLIDFKPIQKAIGQLPHGHVGDYYYADVTIEVQNFVRQIEKYIAAEVLDSIEIDFETADFDFSGRLSPVSDFGCIHIRYGRQRVNDLLKTWIYHLVYCHTAPPDYEKNSYLICKDAAVQFEPLADSLPLLAALLQIYRQGLEIPLHFFPKSSFEYADAVLSKSKPETTALLQAKKKWVGSEFAKHARPESKDPYYDLCFRQFDPFDKQFKKLAIKVFEPLLAHSRKIKR